LRQLVHEPALHVPRLRCEGVTRVTIDAPAEEHDEILLSRIAAWAAAGPVSFLRANKPVWRLEVTRHEGEVLAPAAADAVADSSLVLDILARERQGRPLRSRREILLRAMRRVTDELALARDERRALHRQGYVWAVELGRWDDEAVAALDRKFEVERDGIVALLAARCDPAGEKRWALLARPTGPPGDAVDLGRQTIGFHANRLGVFAEAEAILHYFLYRLD
jgi:hypothetical protein